ncbi:MAG: tetratricopeptide repeat protein [bacterium]
MEKQLLSLVKVSEIILKYSIYILVFLLPVLFLPWTSDVLDFNKQTLLVLFVFIALFSWSAKVLVSGKLSLNLNKTHLAVLALLLVSLGSTIFSSDKYGSFWGWPRVTSESLLTVICLALLYFLVSNILSKKEIFTSITLLALSGTVAVFIGVLQLFGIFLPFGFAKSGAFNTIGLVGSLGLFAAILLPLLFILEIYSKKWLKIIFGIGIALTATALILINYAIVWWVVLAGCALLMLFAVVKRELFDLRWLGLPMFFLVLALFFIILKVQLPVLQRPIEVYLNQSTGIDIALQSIKDHPVLGSGPGTFTYDFSKYRSVDSNQGALWNLGFDGAGSKVLTVLATTGILGFASFLALIATVLFYGIKFILNKDLGKDHNKIYLSAFASALLIAFISQGFAYFFYGSNLTLDFLFFFLIACFIGLIAEEKKEFSLSPSSLLTLGVTFVATAFFIFGLGLLFLDGQRYVAEIYYAKGLSEFASGQIDEGINGLENAVRLNLKSDIYLTQLSEAYLLKLGRIVNDNSLSDADKTRITQILINNAINAAKLATDASPRNANNWSARGFVYQSLIGTIPGAEDWALSSYDQALNLAPSSPYYQTQKGIVYMAKATIIDKDDKDKKNEDLDNAKKQFDKAVELKSDYAPARFQIAMFYQARGQIDEEIAELKEARNYSPNDIGLLFQLGLVYYQEKDYNNARLNLESAVALSSNYANALYFLGLTYSKLGQDGRAIEQFKKVSELNPGNEQIKKILNNLNSGKDPLAGIGQENPPQAPVEEAPAENP